MAEPTYFGCWWTVGHDSHYRSGLLAPFDTPTPWGLVDGGLCPNDPEQRQGVAALHHLNGWTALAFWDRSVDRRRGSNSAFFYEGTLTYGEILARAVDDFPTIFARFDFEIVPAAASEGGESR